MMFHFYFRNFTGKSFSSALTHAFFVSWGKISGKNIFFCDESMFFNYSFVDDSLAVLSKLLSDCAVQRLDGKNISKGIWCIFFCESSQEIFRLFSRNYFPRIWRNFVKKINSLKITSLIFDEKISITVDKTSVYVTKCF